MSPRHIRARAPIAPVLKEPRPTATQENQILLGHCAEVVGAERTWLRVRGSDGYEGWIHEGYCDEAGNPECTEWGWETNADLSLGCEMHDSTGATVNLPLGALVRDGKCVSGRSVTPARRRELFPAEAAAIVASATDLYQGTYYQWGGITPWGADCSGMVQTVHALHGVKLLRDAWQQGTQGVTVEGGIEAIQPADLLFFSDRDDGAITHVAMAVSSRSLVHLAIGRGGHRVESLDRPDAYAKGLIERFRFARRILATAENA